MIQRLWGFGALNAKASIPALPALREKIAKFQIEHAKLPQLTDEQKAELPGLAAMPDKQIDTSERGLRRSLGSGLIDHSFSSFVSGDHSLLNSLHASLRFDGFVDPTNDEALFAGRQPAHS